MHYKTLVEVFVEEEKLFWTVLKTTEVVPLRENIECFCGVRFPKPLTIDSSSEASYKVHLWSSIKELSKVKFECKSDISSVNNLLLSINLECTNKSSF